MSNQTKKNSDGSVFFRYNESNNIYYDEHVQLQISISHTKEVEADVYKEILEQELAIRSESYCSDKGGVKKIEVKLELSSMIVVVTHSPQLKYPFITEIRGLVFCNDSPM